MKQAIERNLFLSASAFVITVLAVGLISSLVIIEDSELAQGLNTEFTPSGKTKHVTLITNETVVQVAPDNALHPGGVMYNAYTFNGTIPGPTVAIDQGDNLTVTLINEGKLVHSYDFHAGLGPKKALSGSVQPGAGGWLYHCGANGLNGVWEHIANGMYGLIVVHPRDEEPAKEFSVVFSEIYNSADQGLFKSVNGMGSFDITKFANDLPDLVLTNGMSFKYAPSVGQISKLELNSNATVFKVKPGEPTRWYITNPGPNDGVAFHFISGQLDVRDGSVANRYGTVDMNDETWWVPPGSASVIETIFPDEGIYVGVDHAMKDTVKGAAFVVLATENATATDIPEGAWVPPKGSDFVGGDQQTQWVSMVDISSGQQGGASS